VGKLLPDATHDLSWLCSPPTPPKSKFYFSTLPMSTAHRPTWDPAQAKDTKAGSRQFSVRDMAAHTKLKFRSVFPLLFPESDWK